MKVKQFTVNLVSREEVKEFIEIHHYSNSINGVHGKYYFGLYNGTELIGAILYGDLAMPNAWKKYSDYKEDAIELRRLCCIDDTPKNTESYFIAKTLKWLKNNTKRRVVVSYADCNQGHEGIIYKASNFKFMGKTNAGKVIIRLSDGKQYHDKTIRTKYKGVLKPFAQRLKDQLENGEAVYRSTLGKNIYTYQVRKAAKKTYYVYKVTSPSNSSYIGVSVNPKHRWSQHCSDVKSALYPVVNKYGRDNLTWEIVYSTNEVEDVYSKEIELIKEFDTYKNGYNRTAGGDRHRGNFKLQECEVLDILRFLREGQLTTQEIADCFDISETTIRAIGTGKQWSSLTGIQKPITRTKLSAKGEKQGNSKLTEKQVILIKTEYMKGKPSKELAELTGVSKVTVEAILHERNWKHVQVKGFVYKKNTKMTNLTKEVVLEIRKDYSDGLKIVDLHNKYGVSRNSVSNIVNLRTWKDA